MELEVENVNEKLKVESKSLVKKIFFSLFVVFVKSIPF